MKEKQRKYKFKWCKVHKTIVLIDPSKFEDIGRNIVHCFTDKDAEHLLWQLNRAVKNKSLRE